MKQEQAEFKIFYSDCTPGTTSCVFSIETESDMKLYITHTTSSIIHEIGRLMQHAFDESSILYKTEISKSIRDSSYISIGLLYRSRNLLELIENKYNYIKKLDTICPNGNNAIYIRGSRFHTKTELAYIDKYVRDDKYFRVNEIPIEGIKGIKRKPVLQLDSNTGKVIRRWESASQAALETGISQGNISSCCRGILQHAYGFSWKFEENYGIE